MTDGVIWWTLVDHDPVLVEGMPDRHVVDPLRVSHPHDVRRGSPHRRRWSSRSMWNVASCVRVEPPVVVAQRDRLLDAAELVVHVSEEAHWSHWRTLGVSHGAGAGGRR